MKSRKWKNGPAQAVNGKRRVVCGRGLALCGVLIAVVVTGAAFAAAPTATPAPRPPEGFGKAKFGMTLEQVRQLYPTLQPAPHTTKAAYFRSPNLTRYVVVPVDVPGLKSQGSVEFRFWKNQLWSVVVYYGSNPFAEVVEHLKRAYGPPSTKTRDPSWVFETVIIITSPGQTWYSFDDSRISQDVERAFLETVEREKQRKGARRGAATPPAGPPPERRATPATLTPQP